MEEGGSRRALHKSDRSWLLGAEEEFARQRREASDAVGSGSSMQAEKHRFRLGGCVWETGPVRAVLTFISSLPSSEGREAMSFQALRKGLLLPSSGKVPFQQAEEESL